MFFPSKKTAGKLECRWSESIEQLKAAEEEPQHNENDRTMRVLIDTQNIVAGRNGQRPPSKKTTRAANVAFLQPRK